jgi:ribosomal protein S18 acetylase RimI-like enzyme
MRVLNLSYYKRYRMEIDLRRRPRLASRPVAPATSSPVSRGQFLARARQLVGERARPMVDVPLLLPTGYRLIPWSDDLLYDHAEVKYLSFRDELDATLFPCFGELEACLRLMREIRQRDGFVPEATWLARSVGTDAVENCGTIQAIRTHRHRANIQNIGVVPRHRSRGVGLGLIDAALDGLQLVGVHHVSLEVTAENASAVKLYQRIGFRTVRTLYKAVDPLGEKSVDRSMAERA